MESKLPLASLKFKPTKIKRFIVHNSDEAGGYIRQMFDKDTIEYNESFVALYLNRANETIAWSKISSGGISSCVVDVKIVLMNAILSGASAIILAHNHPSGTLRASAEDISITGKVREACKLIDMSLLDHFIITKNGYVSMADEGLM
jgi:DNA repair protein RadC